jgi:endonuclease/exonuclease/phosphatase family metal-dependent hydrolase
MPVAALAVGLFVASGALKNQSGPAAGGSLREGAKTTATTRPVLRLATFNIHSGRGSDEIENLDRTADTLRGFDLIGLNELRGESPWRWEDQAEELGRKLEMAWLFAPTERQWWNDSFGNGVLARVPVRFWQRIPLAGSFGRGKRNMLLLNVDVEGTLVRVLVTHIDRGADRQAQLKAVSEMFLALQEPAVLMGDLNSNAGDELIGRLKNAPGVVDAVGTTAGGSAPAGRIDWIFFKGMKCLDAGVVEKGASDHPMVWAEVELKGESGGHR